MGTKRPSILSQTSYFNQMIIDKQLQSPGKNIKDEPSPDLKISEAQKNGADEK